MTAVVEREFWCFQPAYEAEKLHKHSMAGEFRCSLVVMFPSVEAGLIENWQ